VTAGFGCHPGRGTVTNPVSQTTLRKGCRGMLSDSSEGLEGLNCRFGTADGPCMNFWKLWLPAPRKTAKAGSTASPSGGTGAPAGSRNSRAGAPRQGRPQRAVRRGRAGPAVRSRAGARLRQADRPHPGPHQAPQAVTDTACQWIWREARPEPFKDILSTAGHSGRAHPCRCEPGQGGAGQ